MLLVVAAPAETGEVIWQQSSTSAGLRIESRDFRATSETASRRMIGATGALAQSKAGSVLVESAVPGELAAVSLRLHVPHRVGLGRLGALAGSVELLGTSDVVVT